MRWKRGVSSRNFLRRGTASVYFFCATRICMRPISIMLRSAASSGFAPASAAWKPFSAVSHALAATSSSAAFASCSGVYLPPGVEIISPYFLMASGR